jgi:hypothetical protein
MPENSSPAARPKRRYVSTLTAEERQALARAAALARWSKVADRQAELAAANRARWVGFYAEADRQGITDPETRDKMASSAFRREMARMRAIQLRRARQARKAAAASADAADEAAG